MNLYHLGYFLVLAQTEHYGKAAKVLEITQPSLSHAMAALEEEVGVPLFEKSGRNIVLTRYGRLFLNTVTQSLDTLDSGIQHLNDIRDGKGTLRVWYTGELGASLLPELMNRFLSTGEGSQVRFQLAAAAPSSVQEGVQNGSCDLAFGSVKKEEFSDSLSYTPVSQDHLVLLVPLCHPLAEYRSVTLRQTLKYPHIFFFADHPLRKEIENTFQREEEMPRIAYEADSELVIAGMVAQNMGIALLPHSLAFSSFPVRSIAITGDVWRRTNYMIVKKDGYQPPAVLNFYEYVCNQNLSGKDLRI